MAENRSPADLIDASKAAYVLWQGMAVRERMYALQRLQRAVLDKTDTLTAAIVQDTQQPRTDALTAEIYPVLDALRYYRKITPRRLRPKRRKTPLLMFPATSMVEYAPYGVVLVIGPSNFPFQLSLVPAICALAAGNAVIIKPSELSLHVVRVIQQLLEEAKLPEGLVQVVSGGQEIVHSLIEAGPDKIFFTGSEMAGKNVASQAVNRGIPIDLELSGNNPMIVCDDANLERAARAAAWGGFFHAGQVCGSVERVYVEHTVFEPFCKLLAREAAAIRPFRNQEDHRQSGTSDFMVFMEEGASADPGDMGGMLTASGWERVKHQVADALVRGGTVLAGGLAPDSTPPYFPPTVIAVKDDGCALMREETFGPVLAVTSFVTEDEVVQRVNHTRFGLNASIFTANLHRGRNIASQLETGCCSINDVVKNMSNVYLPFGGVKASGQGRYRGPEGLFAFTQTKSVMIHRGMRKRELNWFPYRPRDLEWIQKGLKWLYR